MKSKFYVVWNGVEPGVYDNWTACKRQIEGFPEAKYKSFSTREQAEEAYRSSYWEVVGRKAKSASLPAGASVPVRESLSVDAACSGNPGTVEYRGVYTLTGNEVFRMGPFEQGTNNIGEFLALVHGLALLKNKQLTMPIYSDSANAIIWVNAKKCKTKLEETERNQPLFDLIDRAEKWLRENTYTTPVFKWETSLWGEIPADFGRK